MSLAMTAYKLNWDALFKEVVKVNGIEQTVETILQQFKPMSKGVLLGVDDGLFSTELTLASGETVTLDTSSDVGQFFRQILELRLASREVDGFLPILCCFDKWYGDEGDTYFTFFVACEDRIIDPHLSLPGSVVKFLEVQPWSAGAVALQYERFYETTNVGRGFALEGKTLHVLTAKGRHDVTVARLNTIINLLIGLTALAAINILIAVFG